jgi:hypothetical protein
LAHTRIDWLLMLGLSLVLAATALGISGRSGQQREPATRRLYLK